MSPSRPLDYVKCYRCSGHGRTLPLARDSSEMDKNFLPLFGLDETIAVGKPPHAALRPTNNVPRYLSFSGPIRSRNPHRFHPWCVPGRIGIISAALHEGAQILRNSSTVGRPTNHQPL